MRTGEGACHLPKADTRVARGHSGFASNDRLSAVVRQPTQGNLRVTKKRFKRRDYSPPVALG